MGMSVRKTCEAMALVLFLWQAISAETTSEKLLFPPSNCGARQSCATVYQQGGARLHASGRGPLRLGQVEATERQHAYQLVREEGQG
eukprot:8108755-Pyramimonas_sp.AAC.1